MERVLGTIVSDELPARKNPRQESHPESETTVIQLMCAEHRIALVIAYLFFKEETATSLARVSHTARKVSGSTCSRAR